MTHSDAPPRSQLAADIVLEEDNHWWFSTRTKSLIGILDRYLPPAGRDGRRVLDVGCGAGNMFHHLSRYGQVEGLDNNPKPLAIARQRGYAIQEGSALQMPYSEGVFDLVAALDIVEHVEEDATVMRECYRVCRPGGFFVATVPAFRWLWSHNDVINDHKRRYTRAEFIQLMADAGFTSQRVTYSYFAIFPLAAALILLRRNAEVEPELTTPSLDDDAYQVEMEPAPPLLNTILGTIGDLEAAMVRRVNLPLGTSIIAVGQK